MVTTKLRRTLCIIPHLCLRDFFCLFCFCELCLVPKQPWSQNQTNLENTAWLWYLVWTHAEVLQSCSGVLRNTHNFLDLFSSPGKLLCEKQVPKTTELPWKIIQINSQTNKWHSFSWHATWNSRFWHFSGGVIPIKNNLCDSQLVSAAICHRKGPGK